MLKSPRVPVKLLSDLRNVHHLTLTRVEVELIDENRFPTCFSAFRETLTYLSIDHFLASFNAFVTLVDYFPNITTLRLLSFIPRPNEGPVPLLSRPLRGKFYVEDQNSYPEFFSRFTQLDLEYEELLLASLGHSMKPEFLESALQTGTRTVKILRITADPHCE